MIEFEIDCRDNDYVNGDFRSYHYYYDHNKYCVIYFEYDNYTLSIINNVNNKIYYFDKNKGWIDSFPDNIDEYEPFLTWEEVINIVTLDIL